MKTVVVHRGARDGYQVALALAERNSLSALFTDLYSHRFPQRSHPELPGRLVKTRALSGLTSFALDKLPSVPFTWRRNATRWTDRVLGAAAGRFASAHNHAILSYSYYAHSAFEQTTTGVPRMLFQLHPHPVSVRDILRRELAEAPACSQSLHKEWELSLPEEDFARLAAETKMADCWIVASSFSKKTLVENGIDPRRIHVVPYGVDLERFRPAREPFKVAPSPLRLLFVGTINQRKGISYLLEALRSFKNRPVELLVCGRVVDDLKLFEGLAPQVTVRPSVSHSELLAAYQAADLFVFPSLAEGFGHVLLEALACGLPILSTTSTAAPDLIIEGQEGFVIEPRQVDQLRHRIEWAIAHRAELAAMRQAARRKAETFTWARFRQSIADIVDTHLAQQSTAREELLAHV